jgi:hypothetical protein
MKTPTFDTTGADKTTFAPFILIDARSSQWKDVRLSFSDWDWFEATHGSDTIDDYYFNGYGVQGVVQAARLAAGLEPEAEGIDYDSEGDACFIHFRNFEEAVRTAELAAATIADSTALRRMIVLAREKGFED